MQNKAGLRINLIAHLRAPNSRRSGSKLTHLILLERLDYLKWPVSEGKLEEI